MVSLVTACGGGEDATTETTTTITSQESDTSITIVETTTEPETTEPETTVPALTESQQITKKQTSVDIFTLEGIDGPKTKEYSFGIVDVFAWSVPEICIWNADERAYFVESNGNNENKEYFSMNVDAGNIAADDSYEKRVEALQAQMDEDQANGYECNIQKSDIEKNMVYYSVKKEYVTVDGIDSVKYNVTLCYYQYYKSMKVYSDYYVQFKYEVIKPLGIKDIEKKMDTFFLGKFDEMCVVNGLMPK